MTTESTITTAVPEGHQDADIELQSLRFFPIGLPLCDYIDDHYEDPADYIFMLRAAITLLDKHPNFVREYNDFYSKHDTVKAAKYIEKLVDFLDKHIIYVPLNIKESVEQATKKSDAIGSIKRDTIISTLTENFTISEDQVNELTNEVFNLANYSGVAIGYGPDDENEEGSILHLNLFNF